MPRCRLIACSLVVTAPLLGCVAPQPKPPAPAPVPLAVAPPPEVYRRADADRVRSLEHEIARLRADLRAAEETLLEVESGMKGSQRRAEALSRLAEARIEVDRAAARAPWRADTADEAREKLSEAERQLSGGHIGSAIFFVSRASRIAATLNAEANEVAKSPGARRIQGARVNLRAEPNTTSEVIAVLPADLPVFVEQSEGDWRLVRTVSGEVGFVHADLIGAR